MMRREVLAPGAVVLRGFADEVASDLADAVHCVVSQAPLRHMVVPGGHRMSVAITNCGALGWVSDTTGYRYMSLDPLSGLAWPPLPASFRTLAQRAADAASFAGFVPDACLVNRYTPGTRLSLHQDKDEQDYDAPIVSVSLGIPAVFLFGGLRRADKTTRVPVLHGDVVVWGGPARLRYHGVATVGMACHPVLGEQRINLTLRKAGPAIHP